MTTTVYGQSDDLIEVEGDITGEIGAYDNKTGVLLLFDDGTQLVVKYGKPGLGGAWGITLLKAGPLFLHIDATTEDDTAHYSDVAYFLSGLKSCIAATEWERVK